MLVSPYSAVITEPDKNYYELLGVTRRATRDEIRRAFYQIARRCHPDSSQHDAACDDQESLKRSELFKTVTFAYNTLVDEDRRAKYDRTLPKFDGKETVSFKVSDRASDRDSAKAFGLFGTLRQTVTIDERFASIHDSASFSRMSFGAGATLDEDAGTLEHAKKILFIAASFAAFGVVLAAIGIALL